MKSGPLPWLSIRFEMFVQGIVLLLQTVVSAGLKRGVLAEAAVAPASPRVLTATNVASTQTERVRMGGLPGSWRAPSGGLGASRDNVIMNGAG
jgi:hypothetical protein